MKKQKYYQVSFDSEELEDICVDLEHDDINYIADQTGLGEYMENLHKEEIDFNLCIVGTLKEDASKEDVEDLDCVGKRNIKRYIYE